ncbi:MAG TPA: hypothetical protein VH834_10830 [Solirubrobacteraceae bacterium]|jgi:hypothetical protein
MELVLTVILLGAVVTIVASPLVSNDGRARSRGSRRTAIETARDAKYREILDAELDFQTGKLSEADYREVDRRLRAEASELLGELEAEPAGDGAR